MSNKRAIKSGVWFTISNFLMKSIGFLTTPLFTRLLTKTEYGDFSNFQTWLMIMLYVASFELEASLIRASYDFKEDLDQYIFSMIALSAVSTGIWWIIIHTCAGFFGGLFSMDRTYINCMFLYLFFSPAVNIFQNAERFRYRYKLTVATSMAISVGASLLSVVLVVTMEDKLFARTIGYIMPTALIGIVIWCYYFIKAKRVSLAYWKYALPITLPFIPHLLSMYLLSNMDRVMIKSICGSEALALYSLAYTSGMVITILVNSINSAFSPWLAEKLAEKDYRSTFKMSAPYVAVFSYISAISVLVTPEVLLILGGSSYMDAKYVMPPVTAGCLLQFVYCMYVNIEQFEKKTLGMAAASIFAAALNFVLNYICIPRFGYVAAAYTTYIGYFSLLLLHMYFVRKMGFFHVYNNKYVLFIAVGTSILIFLTNVLMETYILRYTMILVLLALGIALLIKHKDFILKMINSKKHS